MKTILKKTLLAILILGTFINYANEKNTSNSDVKNVKVAFKAVKKGQTISIKDKNNDIIYNDIIQMAGNYSKIFDLTALKNGRYTAELNKDFEIIIKPFIVENGFVTFLANNEKTIYIPLIRTTENLVFISKRGFDKGFVKITLYYGDELIYTETSTEERLLNRTYRLLKNKTGAYKAVVYSNNRSYTKAFKI